MTSFSILSTFNPKIRDEVLEKMTATIKTENNEIIEGVIERRLTQVSYHTDGIKVMLTTGEVGRCLKLKSPEKNELKVINFQIQLKKDLSSNEDNFLEYKETFSFPTKSPEPPNEPSINIQKIIAKTIQAFANSFGGRIYIGIEDRTHNINGLKRDYQFLKDGQQDADGFDVNIRSVLPKFFDIKNRIYNSVRIDVFPFQDEDICIINVEPSEVPFVIEINGKYEFHVREGGNSMPKTITEFLEYWPKHLMDLKKSKSLEFLEFGF